MTMIPRTMISILSLIMLSIIPIAITSEEENIRSNTRLSLKIRRDQFETSVLANGYCGTSEADANSRCILCRDASECSNSENCILLENCGGNVYDEYQMQENEQAQNGYCAPNWIDAAKCLYYDYTCTADRDCSTDDHSCFFSIDWCVPGEILQTFFCAKDLDNAMQCEESKQCYSENDVCSNNGETCIETDSCSMVTFGSLSPTQAKTSLSPSQAVTTKSIGSTQSDAPIPVLLPNLELPSRSSPTSASIRNKTFFTLASIFVSGLALTTLIF